MKSWTIRGRVLLSFVVILALMTLMSGVAWHRLGQIGEQTASLEHDSLPGLTASRQLLVHAMRNHALTLHHVISLDPAEMKALEQERTVLVRKLEQFSREYRVTITSSEDTALFDAYERALPAYLRIQEEAFELSRTLQNDAADTLATTQLTPEFEKVQAALEILTIFNKRNADASTHQIAQAVDSAKRGVLVTFALALLVALACGVMLLRAITQPLQHLMGAVDVMRTGDFSRRLTLPQRDEFASLADGFNRMSDCQTPSSFSRVCATTRRRTSTSASETRRIRLCVRVRSGSSSSISSCSA